MTAPLHQTFSDLTGTLVSLSRPPLLPPSVPADDRLVDAWRGSVRQVDDAILFIRVKQRTIAEGRYPRDVANAKATLPARLAGYLATVRRISEFEERMERASIPFERRESASPDDIAISSDGMERLVLSGELA